MSHLPLDARAILEYLNELGYRNISGEQLKEFIKDLRKLIKYEEKLGIRYRDPRSVQDLYRKTTASFRAKIDDRLDLITDVSALRLRPSSRCSGSRFHSDMATGYATYTSSLPSSDTIIQSSDNGSNTKTHLINKDSQKTTTLYPHSSTDNMRSSGNLKTRYTSVNGKENQKDMEENARFSTQTKEDAYEAGKRNNRKFDVNKQVTKIMERERQKTREMIDDPIARGIDVDRNGEEYRRSKKNMTNTNQDGVLGHRRDGRRVMSTNNVEVKGRWCNKEPNMIINHVEDVGPQRSNERMMSSDHGINVAPPPSRERTTTNTDEDMGHRYSNERINNTVYNRVIERRRSGERIKRPDHDEAVRHRYTDEYISNTDRGRGMDRRRSRERTHTVDYGRVVEPKRSAERKHGTDRGGMIRRERSGERMFNTDRGGMIRRERNGERMHGDRGGIVRRSRSGDRFHTANHGRVVGRGYNGVRVHSAERADVTGHGRNAAQSRTRGQRAEFGYSSERSYNTAAAGFTNRRPNTKMKNSDSHSTLISRRFAEGKSRRHMNTDPVALYQYYKNEWEYFRDQIPDDNKRSLERWNVRRLHLDPH